MRQARLLQPPQASRVTDIAAIVNGEVIRNAEVDAYHKPLAPSADERKRTLDDLIGTRLLAAAARSSGLAIDRERSTTRSRRSRKPTSSRARSSMKSSQPLA
jgi:hypothetical protein